MIHYRLAVILALLVASVPACSGATTTTSKDIAAPGAPALRILDSWTGMQSPVDQRSCTLIREQASWADAWARAGLAPSELPTVDFTSASIVAVFHGADRAHHSMDATLSRDGEDQLLRYELFSTSGERSPEVRPFGFYLVPRSERTIRVESHHVHGPSQPIVEVVGTLGR